MDDEFCRERVRTIRELADSADPFIKRRLLELAVHYEKRLMISDKRTQRVSIFRADKVDSQHTGSTPNDVATVLEKQTFKRGE